MATTNQEIMQQFVNAIVPEIKRVSSFVADTVESQVSEAGFEISISSLINVVIDGRGPTKSGRGEGPTLQQRILRWISSKGITPRPNPNGSIPTPEQLSWMISRSIHRDGNILYQRGGGNNVFAGIITDERIENLVNLIGDNYFQELKKIKLPKQ